MFCCPPLAVSRKLKNFFPDFTYCTSRTIFAHWLMRLALFRLQVIYSRCLLMLYDDYSAPLILGLLILVSDSRGRR